MGRRVVTVAVGLALALMAGGCSPHSDRSTSSPSANTPLTEPKPATAPPVPAGTGSFDVVRVDYLDSGDADPAENWADLYLPTGDRTDDSLPLVTIIHGGGWESRAGAEQFDEMARDLADRGLAVYNVEYRRLGTGGGWPTTFHDVARALDHVPTIADTYPQLRIDDELVIGHSAGAQLAVWRVVPISGPLDMRYAVDHGNNRVITHILGGTPQQVPEHYDSVDPIRNLDPALPVTLFHGLADTDVDPNNSRRYTRALDAAGGSTDLHLFDGETHTSLVHRQSPAYTRILDRLTEIARTDIDELRDE